MSLNRRHIIHARRLSFTEALGRRIEQMAVEREMTLDALLTQLVELGVQSLEYKPLPMDPWQRDEGPAPEPDLSIY